MKSALFVSFAPRHSSHVRRMQDAAASECSIEEYITEIDKTRRSLLVRIASLDYLRLFMFLMRSNHAIWWLWGADACFVGSLAKLFRPAKRLIWDVSDINPHLLRHKFISPALRAVEALLLKQADRLLLTSPEFYSKHFSGKIDSNKVVVVENYLTTDMHQENKQPVTAPPPLKIVYAGIFRSERVLEIIATVAEELRIEAEFSLYGYASKDIDQRLLSRLSLLPNVQLKGTFTHLEIPEICHTHHLILGLLDPHADENEQWLLPNRIYHAGAFRRPILTNEGTYTSEVVKERRLGLVCSFSPAGVAEAIRNLLAENGRLYHDLQEAIPQDGLYFLKGHYSQVLDEVARGKN
ncbi:hypothetical protein [Bradyrhizobium lupini]|uniref:hypothetical protein n=1 Tax=Rhizobium lupini TaxID=136996 RepID=UPI0034C6D89E